MSSPKTTGSVTLPIEVGMDDTVKEMMLRLGADAVRNSDGTDLPDIAHELGAKVYSTYFPARGDQAWALANPDSRPHFYVMSNRVTAPSDAPLSIRVIDGWFERQIEPDTDVDVTRWWQVIDRTTGEDVPTDQWSLEGTGADAVVTVEHPQAFHVYTVDFLAKQIWDSTQMYNYITNNWEADPTRDRSIGYDVRHAATWEHMKSSLQEWLDAHPEVTVVRFTTFFYHFTLMFGADGKERYVDWFGYTGSVGTDAIEQFEAETGFHMTAEDFVDQGYYNSYFRQPTDKFRAWIDFQQRFVTERVGQLVDIVHAAGREAMMFLGDTWMGAEPYGPYFEQTHLDAVAGSVGSAATCRMISDIPYISIHEGRFLPYFFPDVFNPEGDPLGEANTNWIAARRAILRKPLDRIGYGGYLSLAMTHPEFVDRIEQIVQEFRDIKDLWADGAPKTAPFKVGLLNAWGKLRTWQTHMVAHALPYTVTDPYSGVLEALAGLPIDVEFLSFDDVRQGVPEGVGVLVTAGDAHTAFTGGSVWADPELQTSLRRFVAQGGGLIGVGEPSEHAADGAVFQLSDIFGVEREYGWGLSTDRYLHKVSDHPLQAPDCGDLTNPDRWGLTTPNVVALDADILADEQTLVRLATHDFGQGRSVYISGLPWSFENARLLLRAIFWAANASDELEAVGLAEDPRVDVTQFPTATLVTNNAEEPVETTVSGPWGSRTVSLPSMGATLLDWHQGK